jgi:tripartite-type tricarboxylate transporter receptor subunit TctC
VAGLGPPLAEYASNGMFRTIARLFFALALAAFTLHGGGAVAQTYPSKPIRIIVPFVAGGAVDALARMLGAKLSESLGQPVIVENRPGAGGNIAADAVAKSPPDGYTILQNTNGQAISPAIYRSLPFDVVRDFVPVTQLVGSQLVLVASPKLPAGSVLELIALAKAKPGTLNYGMTGAGNPLHLTMEMFKTAAGIDIQAVPYKGDKGIFPALITGEIQVAVAPMATTLPHVTGGTLRALAVAGAKRSAALPDGPPSPRAGSQVSNRQAGKDGSRRPTRRATS